MTESGQLARGLVNAAFLLTAATLSAGSAIFGAPPILTILAGIGLTFLAIARLDYAIICWLAFTVFTPQWTQVDVAGINLDPSTIAALPIFAGMIVAAASRRHPVDTHLNFVDILVVLGIAITIMRFAMPGSIQTTTAVVIAWLAAYIFGRRSTVLVQKAFVVMMMLVAVWGIAEFATGLHFFENWYPAPWHDWNAIQARAGVARSEATFGHAIAYGASLAMAIPFAHLFRFQVPIQIVLFLGILASISRGPMFAAIITLCFGAFFMAKGSVRLRASVIIPLLIGGYAIAEVLSYVSTSSNAEFSKSDQARLLQFEKFAGSLNWFTTSLGDISNETIDSTPLRLAVNFGIITALLLLSPIALAIWNMFNVRQAPASIALVGQIVVLLVTSPILQWSVLVFFLMGMASAENTAYRGSMIKERKPLPTSLSNVPFSHKVPPHSPQRNSQQ